MHCRLGGGTNPLFSPQSVERNMPRTIFAAAKTLPEEKAPFLIPRGNLTDDNRFHNACDQWQNAVLFGVLLRDDPGKHLQTPIKCGQHQEDH
jgi:hypothetical protein